MAVPIKPTKMQIHTEFGWIACYFFNGSWKFWWWTFECRNKKNGGTKMDKN